MSGKGFLLVLFGFLIVLFTVVGAMAYQVGQPLDVRVKLQFDNGSSLVDVLSQACILSVYSESSQSLVVRDGVMSVSGGYHNFTFVPVSVGGYVVSVQCSFNNESAIYHDSVSVDNVVVSVGGGGGVLNLDAKLVVPRSSYVVNVGVESVLGFDVEYFSGGVLSNSNFARWSVVSGDVVLDSGGFSIAKTGVYSFDFDFKDYVVGDYKVLLNFDGRSSSVDLKVIDVGADLSMITGFVTGVDGKLSVLKLGGLLFVLFFLVLLLVFFVRSVGKKEGGGRVEYREVPRNKF